MNPSKDTIYVDPEDEITSLIDKVQSSEQKIVALVLPKRMTVLQSVVNMRLLKKAADDASKRLVLITSEASLLPLAGVAGVHIARNLTSKPSIPPSPVDGSSAINESDPVVEQGETDDTPVDKAAAVGALAAASDDTETVELDDVEPPIADKAKKSKVAGAKSKKDKKLLVPNFDKFRLWLLIGALALIGLIVFLIFAIFILPKATVTLTTETIPVNATLTATTSGQAKEVDEAKNILPAAVKDLKQATSEKAAATGQKDVGTKASGVVTITNCTDNGVAIPAGTGISKDGLTFLTTETVNLDEGEFTSGGVCQNNGDHVETVDVIAQTPGDKFNVAPVSGYQVAGAAGDVRASGGQMSGGVSKVIRVATDQDVDGAKQKIATKTANSAEDFYKQLESTGSVVLRETGTNSDPKVIITPGVGQEATEITVTQEVTYSVMTVAKDDLTKLLTNALKKEINTKTQELSPGDVLEKATLRLSDRKSPTDATLTVDKSTIARPIIDTESLKREVVGMKSGEVKGLLNNRPGIKQVDVKFSPFWVSNTPKKTDKITVNVNTGN